MLRTLTFQVYSFEEIDASMEVKTNFFPAVTEKKEEKKEKRRKRVSKLSAPILQHVSEKSQFKSNFDQHISSSI